MELVKAGARVIGKQLLRKPSGHCCLMYSPLYCQVCYHSQSSNTGWDYSTERKTFQLKTPEYYNFARDVIDKWAEKEKTGERGDNPALWWINESGNELKWNFQDLSDKSKMVANILTGPCKLKAGDLIIVMLPRVPEWWLINIAAIRAGIILSPGTTLLRSKDIEYRFNASGAKCIITNAACADYVDEVAKGCPTLVSKVIVGSTSVSIPKPLIQ